MDVDLRLAAFVDAMLDLLEHAHARQVGEAAIDRLFAFEEPLLRVDAGPKPLEGLARLEHPVVRLRGRFGGRVRWLCSGLLFGIGIRRGGGIRGFRRKRRFADCRLLRGGHQGIDHRSGFGGELQPGRPR